MAKPPYIELGHGRDAERIPILYEDRSVIAIDKPRGWMLVPFTWQRTSRNLQAAIQSSIGAGAFWARCRQVRFLRYVHRLDADTTGVLLFARSPGAVNSLGELFESRRMEKRYLAVALGEPKSEEWTCRQSLAKDPRDVSRMCVDAREGKEAETRFRVLARNGRRCLIEAHPYTGRTHQIRVHLAESGLPILGDELYGVRCEEPLALRAVELRYTDPFSRRPIRVRAPVDGFLADYGFEKPPASEGSADVAPGSLPDRSNSSSKRFRQTPPP
ncbi:MAG: RluA family pseudouridine synthase [Verrucomicrobiales bacterium]|nr:RluA family pseudouridine synthase [Verrucomicrobiales bacterium]